MLFLELVLPKNHRSMAIFFSFLTSFFGPSFSISKFHPRSSKCKYFFLSIHGALHVIQSLIWIFYCALTYVVSNQTPHRPHKFPTVMKNTSLELNYLPVMTICTQLTVSVFQTSKESWDSVFFPLLLSLSSLILGCCTVEHISMRLLP